jgi:endonuclease/exonuclease/phosphatase (EEP) superfamily protein YafD
MALRVSGLITAFAWLLAVGGGGLLALTLAGEIGRWHVPLDIINHFRPLILLGALGLLVPALALIGRRGGGIAVVCTLLVIVAQGRLVLPEYVPLRAAQASAPAATVFTVATFNMLKQHSSPQRLADWVREQGIDVIVLQEVGIGGRAGVAALSKVLPYVHAPPGAVSLLSRYPLTETELVQASYRGRVRILPDLIAATVAVPGRDPVRIVGVHFGWPQPAGIGQPVQFDWLARDYLARQRPERIVLTGDFNSAPTSFEFSRLEAMLPLPRATLGLMSFPTRRGVFGLRPPLPFLAIDHVFAGGDLNPQRVARGPNLGSDHYPVMVRFSLR